MPVFDSQFSRARSYAVAYVGDGASGRFWTPNAVTAAVIAGAGALVAAAVVDAAVDGVSGNGDAVGGDVMDGLPDLAGLEALAAAPGAIDPQILDDATLALPGVLVEPPLPGAGELSGFPGMHTSSAIGGVDITADDAAQLAAPGSSEWSHYSEGADTYVGGDGEGFSYVMTDSGTVYSDGGGVSSDGPLMGF